MEPKGGSAHGSGPQGIMSSLMGAATKETWLDGQMQITMPSYVPRFLDVPSFKDPCATVI